MGAIEGGRSPNKRWTKIQKDASCHHIGSGPHNEVSLVRLSGLQNSINKMPVLGTVPQKDEIIESIKNIQMINRNKRNT
jgi:hypothetical protein